TMLLPQTFLDNLLHRFTFFVRKRLRNRGWRWRSNDAWANALGRRDNSSARGCCQWPRRSRRRLLLNGGGRWRRRGRCWWLYRRRRGRRRGNPDRFNWNYFLFNLGFDLHFYFRGFEFFWFDLGFGRVHFDSRRFRYLFRWDLDRCCFDNRFGRLN